MRERIYLSSPQVTETEIEYVTAALRSGWVAPLGPDVDAFEAEMCAFANIGHAVALSSGTAALHLGLLALGVNPGDDVIVPTLTFAATAFAVHHAGARPVFLDSEEQSWNLDPQLLDEVLSARAASGNLPAAIITVDLFGRTCDYAAITQIAAKFEVPILEDAAEALGSSCNGVHAGAFGRAGIFSFNGNKVMTTSGGGMFVTDDPALASRVRYLSTQAREPLPWYEHKEIGYNYRLSNVLAALGRGQLSRLDEMITRRVANRAQYALSLGGIDGVAVVMDPPWGPGNAWLTNIRFDSALHPGAPEAIRLALETLNIESRPVWKPMHQQPVFAAAESHLTGAADRIFADGLCLPSGPNVTQADIELVCESIIGVLHP
ncbi:MAG: aminotransferase class I/II-fold pyridoxal phosphate-dependent enzyme [Actinomycetota bacterium]|nr:aminotransferase class I/II-fold pyridoxal phosphate-dependent enzyme [Actinomycetota bacterium]MDP2287470.1 aminotransferase class I/II-fold pyridoxal phosphate-dependent enzyme [Actinomycetota bacterium]